MSAAPPRWMRQARCAATDPELWFSNDTATRALHICQGCEARLSCLEYALNLPDSPDGIWGGATPEQLRELRARREAAA